MNHSLSAKAPPTQGNHIPINRDKASIDIFRRRDQSLEDSDNLPDPDVLAQEIVEDLEGGLKQFREIANDLGTMNRSKRE